MGNEAQDSALGGGIDGVLVQYKVFNEVHSSSSVFISPIAHSSFPCFL